MLFIKLWPKVLAKRLKPILPNIISTTHSAFIPGRQINDNVLVAYELMNYLNLKKKGKMSFMSIKVDMNKTYDRIERCFLEVVMLKLDLVRDR